MDPKTITQILEIVGRTAGIGGLSLGVILLIYREIIRKNIFPTLTQKQTYRIFNKLINLITIVAIIGIFTWIISIIIPIVPAKSPRKVNLKQAYPIITPNRPIEAQVQLFATDKVKIYADPDILKEVWFGEIWEPYEPGREYIVWGYPNRPVIPQFKFEGNKITNMKMQIDFSVYYTENLEKPRDIRSRSRVNPNSNPFPNAGS